MAFEPFSALLLNIACLLAMGVIVDSARRSAGWTQGAAIQVLWGVVVGLLGMGCMISGIRLESGWLLDGRFVVLAVCALLLRWIPTVVAVSMVVLFIVVRGGPMTWVSVAGALSVGGVGVAWREIRGEKPGREFSWAELLLFGLVVHLVSAAWWVALPAATAGRVLAEASLAVVCVLPLATAGLAGWCMTRCSRRDDRSAMVDTPVAKAESPDSLAGVAPKDAAAQRRVSAGVEALLNGIAHDLNNMLAPIVITVPMLRETATHPEDRDMLRTIEDCARKATRLLPQWGVFARWEPGQRVALPLRHLLRSLEVSTRGPAFPSSPLSVRMTKDLWWVNGDPARLHDALSWLCAPVRVRSAVEGQAVIEAANLWVGPETSGANPGCTPGPHVHLRVRSSATEMDSEIGGILREHGAFWRFVARPDGGADLNVYFPAAPEAGVGETGGTGSGFQQKGRP